MVHVLVHAVKELRSYDAIVCCLVGEVYLVAGLRGEFIEGVDALGVEYFVHAAFDRVALVGTGGYEMMRAHNGLSSLGLSAEAPVNSVR